MALSSISGNNSSAIIETSSNISDRVLPAVCSYAHENFTPAGTRYLDSLNLQRHIHESVNESRPLKFAVDCSELLHRSASSGSFNKLRHLRSIADMQKSRNQRATSIIATINDDDGISVASNVNEIIAPTVPSPTTVTSHFSPYAFFFECLCCY